MNIEIEDGLSPEQQETVRAFALAVKQGNKDGVESLKLAGDWSKATNSGVFYIGTGYRIEKPTPEDYLEGHRASGLKVGDRVKVVRKWNHGEQGYPIHLGLGANHIGATVLIAGDEERNGFTIYNGTAFPHFVLEKIEPKLRPWKGAEALGERVRRKSNPNRVYLIIQVDTQTGLVRLTPSWTVAAEGLLEEFETDTGAPCGVEEGGE